MTNFEFMCLSVLSIMVGFMVGYYAPGYLLLVLPIYLGCIFYAKVKIENITETEAARKLSDPMENAFNVIIGEKRD